MIRKACNADRSAIGKIYCETWKEAYKNLLPDDYLLKLNQDFCMPKSENLTNYLIAETDNAAVGIINYGVSRDNEIDKSGEIRAIYVLPQFWHKGFGTELFLAAKSALKKLNYTSVYLWVLAENASAIKFYEKMQMHPLNVKRNINIGGTDLVEIKFESDL